MILDNKKIALMTDSERNIFYNARVMLDGKKVARVVYVDTAKGIVRHHKVDATGQLIRVPGPPSTASFEVGELQGEVQLVDNRTNLPFAELKDENVQGT